MAAKPKPLFDSTDDDGSDRVVWIKEERTENVPRARNFQMKIKCANIVDNETGEPLGWVPFARLRLRESE